MFHAKFNIAGFILLPPFQKWPKYGPIIAKHGPHMVHQIGSSRIIIIVPRDDPCQISQFWVHPIVPFS